LHNEELMLELALNKSKEKVKTAEQLQHMVPSH